MIEIRLLTPKDNRKNFDCGNLELNYYFQRFAGQNQFKNFIGSNYIVINDGNILGFMSVSTGEIYKQSLPPGDSKALPNYPLPVIKLTRLGVKVSFQKSGIEKLLIKHVLKLALEQKKSFGCIGILVDAKKDAINYYTRLGFIHLEEIEKSHRNLHSTLMYLSIKTIEKTS